MLLFTAVVIFGFNTFAPLLIIGVLTVAVDDTGGFEILVVCVVAVKFVLIEVTVSFVVPVVFVLVIVVLVVVVIFVVVVVVAAVAVVVVVVAVVVVVVAKVALLNYNSFRTEHY